MQSRSAAYLIPLVALLAVCVACNAEMSQAEEERTRAKTLAKLNAHLKQKVASDEVEPNLEATSAFLDAMVAKSEKSSCMFVSKSNREAKLRASMNAINQFLGARRLLEDKLCHFSSREILARVELLERKYGGLDRLRTVAHQSRLDHAKHCAPTYFLEMKRSKEMRMYPKHVKQVEDLLGRQVGGYPVDTTRMAVPSMAALWQTEPDKNWASLSYADRVEALKRGIFYSCKSYTDFLCKDTFNLVEMEAKVRRELPSEIFEFMDSLEYQKTKAACEMCRLLADSDRLEEASRDNEQYMRAEAKREARAIQERDDLFYKHDKAVADIWANWYKPS